MCISDKTPLTSSEGGTGNREMGGRHCVVFFSLEKRIRMTRKRQRRFLVHGTLKLEPRQRSQEWEQGNPHFLPHQMHHLPSLVKYEAGVGSGETENS